MLLERFPFVRRRPQYLGPFLIVNLIPDKANFSVDLTMVPPVRVSGRREPSGGLEYQDFSKEGSICDSSTPAADKTKSLLYREFF